MRSSLGRAARRHCLRVSPRGRRQSYSAPSLSRAWACSLANRRTSQRNARSERDLSARHDANADADGSAEVLAASGRCNDGLIAPAVVVAASWLNNHHLLPHLRSNMKGVRRRKDTMRQAFIHRLLYLSLCRATRGCGHDGEEMLGCSLASLSAVGAAAVPVRRVSTFFNGRTRASVCMWMDKEVRSK